MDEAKKRDYKDEYKKFQSSTKAKKYRAELNKYNRQKGTYGNGDGKDASHKGGKIVGFETQSKNRGRAEKSRLKKEASVNEVNTIQKIDRLAKRNKYGTVDGTQMNAKTARQIIAIFNHPKMNSYKSKMLKMKAHELADLTWKLGKALKIEGVIKVSKKDDIPGNAMKMRGEEKIKKLTYSGSNGKGGYEIKGKNLNVIGIRPRDKGFFVRHFTNNTGFRKANLYYDGVQWQGGKKFESVNEDRTLGTKTKDVYDYLLYIKKYKPKLFKNVMKNKHVKKIYDKRGEMFEEGFGGDLKGEDKKKFEKARKENAEQLGYKLTGKSDIREDVDLDLLRRKKKYRDAHESIEPVREIDDDEGKMAKSQLERSMKYAKMIYNIIQNVDKGGDGNVQFPSWVQSKLTKSMDYLQGVYNYLDGKDGLEDKFQTEDLDTPPKYSSKEAKLHIDADVKKMSKFLGKASQECIRIMMDGVKAGKYDALDIQRGIKFGAFNRTHEGERPFMSMLWRKVRKGFRRYMPKGKLRK